MASISTTPPRDLLALTPAQIATCLVFLQPQISRATSGHGRGGTDRAYARRRDLRRDLGHRHVFQWQILRGVTAIGASDDWLSELRNLVSDLCAEDSVRCWIDPTHAEADQLIDAGVASKVEPLAQPNAVRLSLMREASELAPTVNLGRRTASPVVIFTPAWADFLGASSALIGNAGWLELVDRLRLAGFRVVILCRDARAMARRFPEVVDYTLPLLGMGDWVFHKLCTALCGRSLSPRRPLRGSFFDAATPTRLNECWQPGLSPEVLRIRIEESWRPKHQGDE